MAQFRFDAACLLVLKTERGVKPMDEKKEFLEESVKEETVHEENEGEVRDFGEEDRARTKKLKSRILGFLMKKKYKELRDATSDMHPADLAAILEDLDENNRLVVFRLLRKDVATEAFTFMEDEARAELVEGFSDAEIINTIEEISLDDAADMLEDMPASVVKRVLAKSSQKTRESLNKLLNYPEYSAGSIMTPEYVRFRKEMDVRQAIEAIREQGPDAETVYTGYVVDQNRLLGVVSAKDLLLSDPSTPIAEVMDDHVVTVKVTDDQEFVALQLQKYDFNAMPVVDEEGMLVGIVTIDDAIDVLTDESTEDMQKMAAIIPDEQAASYFGTTVLTHAKQRIPWLLILMLSATLTGMVTAHYESAFNAIPLLVAFMPMLMDTPGNCGNQVCTLMVRGLALGEVTVQDIGRVIWKEVRVSALVGCVLGIVNGGRILLMYRVIPQMTGKAADPNAFRYAIVVSIALFCAIVLSKLVGAILPLAAKLVGADPALVATPFITTIVDACSLIIFFHIAEVVFASEITTKLVG
ncbi:MAG: magnesium transporter [Lachnospiraceae bacterium]|nr:magnesium transporter [Lachnospiraceae bacterium]